MFRTQYQRILVATNPGDAIKVEYYGRIGKDGEVEIKEKGHKDLYAYIQSFADEADIINVIERFVKGDTSVLTQRKGEYMDVSNMPKTFAEVLETVNKANNLFDELPVEVRAKFDHDINKFIAGIGTKEWNEALKVEDTKPTFTESGTDKVSPAAPAE